SRRRHTGSKRDWSSDVCSSELVGDGGEADGGEEVVEVVVEVAVEVGGGGVHGEGGDHGENLWLRGLARSESILVGRLGRSAEIVVEIGDLVVEVDEH